MSVRGSIFVVLSAVLIFVGLISVTVPRLSHVNGPHIGLVSFKERNFRAPKPNVWADLAKSDVVGVLEFLHGRENGLNLTTGKIATSWDNYVLSVEALPPPKSKALNFLDESAETPPLHARVVVYQGVGEVVQFCEYEVGPLPVTTSTTISPLVKGHVGGRHCIKNPVPDYLELTAWFGVQAIHLADIMADLLGDALDFKGELRNIQVTGRLLRTVSGKTLMWTSVHTDADAWSLLPQGLYLQLDVSTRNSAKWTITKWFYNGRLYNSTEQFRAAWESGTFVKSKPNLNDGWADIDDAELDKPGTEFPPPLMIQPEGQRYKLDEKESFISWMGFEFYITSRSANAMTLYDIRFRGERIMYELGLQEAMAHYAGDNPMQSGQVWLDTTYGMGLRMFELVPGYDCPAYASYLGSSFSRREQRWDNPRGICVFEYTADYPLQRHTTDNYVSISRNTYLVVRSVSTVGNYDYTIEYIFYLDGTIEVKVRASGYIFSAFWDAPAGDDQGPNGEDEYGYRVNDVVSGSLHDHVINFKADLDIAGTANSLHRLDILPHTTHYPWDSALESPRKSMHLQTCPFTTETGLNWAPNSASTYMIVNNDSRNDWGEKRAYRIVPGTGLGTPPHLTVLNSTSLQRASLWAEKDLWVI